MPDEALVELMRRAFTRVNELSRSLAAEDWDRPTDLPGWTVKDNVSHLCGIEAWLLGCPRPDPITGRAHVRNDLGAGNEADVELRRSWPPDQILQEFRELTEERLRVLAALGPDDWEGEMMTPIGRGPMRELVSIRILDVFYHEQDMRRATGTPAGVDGDVADFVVGRMARTLAATVGKRVAPPEGTVVSFELSTPPALSIAYQMLEGRAMAFEGQPARADVRLRMTSEALLCLCGGRWDVERALADGRVEIEGDAELGRSVLRKMAVMP